MNIIYAFLLSLIASISTLLGTIPIYIKTSKKLIIGVFKVSFITLMIVSLLELIPDSIKLINDNYNIYLSILIAIILFTLGLFTTKCLDNKVGEGNTYYRIGIISMIAMILHNIPEGIITYITTTNDFKLGLLVTITILFHNIPEGLIIALPIYYATKKRGKAILYTLLSGTSELLGAVLSYLFLSKLINNFILGLIYSFTAGIMIYVSLFELLPFIKRKKEG